MYFVREYPDKVRLYEVSLVRFDICNAVFFIKNVLVKIAGFFNKRFKADFSNKAFLEWLSRHENWWTSHADYPPGTKFTFKKVDYPINAGLSFRTGDVPHRW